MTKPAEEKGIAPRLKKLSACPEAIEWVGSRDLQAAWAECERGDWMLWFAARVKTDRRLLVRAACYCAREALCYVPAGEDRPWYAIEVTLAWCDGRATLYEVRAAAAAAYGAYADAAYAAAAYAAAAAAYGAYADAAAAAAAAAAADTADAAAAADARSRKRSAEIVRSVIRVEDMP